MRVLIAGATGYLGGRLAARLSRDGHEVMAGVREASNIEPLARRLGRLPPRCPLDRPAAEIAAVLSGWRPDATINCVCDYGRGGDATRVEEANYRVPLRLLRACESSGVPLFVNAGTSLPPEVSIYAEAKARFSGELRAAAGAPQRVDLVLQHFYGPDEPPDHFVGWLIDQLLRTDDALPMTAGEQLRDFIYIDDLVEAIVAVVANCRDHLPAYTAIDVGSGEVTSIRDLVDRVRLLCGAGEQRCVFGAKPYRANEVMYSRADVGHLRTLGWEPSYDLTGGLKRCIDAYRKRERSAA